MQTATQKGLNSLVSSSPDCVALWDMAAILRHNGKKKDNFGKAAMFGKYEGAIIEKITGIGHFTTVCGHLQCVRLCVVGGKCSLWTHFNEFSLNTRAAAPRGVKKRD